ncbi:MAG: hydrogen peroxide-inducible genes activator [Fulvimarina manganoxydans]|uniref:hydrogen peroxide-inducible genes activator n=1 Tax=Fulvimarina manganoxydans TaxID=937218 RepID=UPI0023558A09|nr:hydrogen peroxide-inducible genes activator [Fulvimarina manganoxydans]MCK5933705.1 hydrogen peroxide-inducible genes activator [Fulvimarina manganoxydans]
MLTLRQFRYFQALAETLHFGKAARRLNISQPALSGQIAQMETFFATALFTRGSAGVSLTADGEMVGERIQRILNEVRDLEGLSDRGAGPLGKRLRIGMIATVAPYLVPRLLPALAKDFPSLDCEIRESVTERLLSDLKLGEIDCAVVALPLHVENVETLPLFDDPFHLAVPAAEAASLPTPVPAPLLTRQRMILLEEGHCLRTQTIDVCRLADGSELASLGATSLTTLLRMVAGGLGTTLVPEMAVADETQGAGIAILPLAPPVPARRLVLAFRPTTVRLADFETLAGLICQTMDKPRLGGEPGKPKPIEGFAP